MSHSYSLYWVHSGAHSQLKIELQSSAGLPHQSDGSVGSDWSAVLAKSPTSFRLASLGAVSWQWYSSYLSQGAGNGPCLVNFCATPLANLPLTKASDRARPESVRRDCTAIEQRVSIRRSCWLRPLMQSTAYFRLALLRSLQHCSYF